MKFLRSLCFLGHARTSLISWLGSPWKQYIVVALEDKQRVDLVVEIGEVYMKSYKCIKNIVVERNSLWEAENISEKLLPSIIPREMVKLSKTRRLQIARLMGIHLERWYLLLQIYKIIDRLKRTVYACIEEWLPKVAIDIFLDYVLFVDVWAPLAQLYSALDGCYGEDVTLFYGNSTVESYFLNLR